MCVFWLVTSSLLANLYREFCDIDDLEEPTECDDINQRFIATPVLGFICFAGWVRKDLHAYHLYTSHTIILLWLYTYGPEILRDRLQGGL